MRNTILKLFQKLWGPQTASWRVLAPGIALTVLLLLLPTGFEGALIYQDAEKVRATVLEVDNGAIINNGIIQNGEQYCTLRIEEGSFAGQETGGVNLLSGSLEQDKMFAPGDSALVVVSHADGQITSVTMIDHYRIHWEIFLAAIFGLLLVLFAGPGGLRALLSFAITVLSIWKIMVPATLKGADPIGVGSSTTGAPAACSSGRSPRPRCCSWRRSCCSSRCSRSSSSSLSTGLTAAAFRPFWAACWAR